MIVSGAVVMRGELERLLSHQGDWYALVRDRGATREHICTVRLDASSLPVARALQGCAVVAVGVHPHMVNRWKRHEIAVDRFDMDALAICPDPEETSVPGPARACHGRHAKNCAHTVTGLARAPRVR